MTLEYIETPNLILRKAKPTDLENIWNNIWKDSTIAENMLWPVTLNLEDAISRLERTIVYQASNYAYFVCLKTSDEVIGFAGVKEEQPCVFEESGICIAVKYQGNGYAKEVVCALSKLIFEALDGKRFLYGCFSTNEKSKRVCLSQGFKYLLSEKIVREWDNKEFLIDYYYLDKADYEKMKDNNLICQVKIEEK